MDGFKRGIAAIVKQLLCRSILNTKIAPYPYFEASMEMKDFPRCGSEREAALKLAEWMQRMGAAIENYWSEP
nr:hypothetical protein [Cronobacter sakazakii]